MDGGGGFPASTVGFEVWKEELEAHFAIRPRALRQASAVCFIGVSVVSTALVQLS